LRRPERPGSMKSIFELEGSRLGQTSTLVPLLVIFPKSGGWRETLDKLLWIDMEMTGLDVSKEAIIEVAAIVTSLELVELDAYETVIKQPQSYLDAMDEWNTKHHGESGLTARVPTGRAQGEVEAELVALVDRHFPKSRPVLAGNSIAQDRLFIDRHMPALAAKLHYRVLDVTSWKIIMAERFDLLYDKKKAHRALDDIRESIGELRFYLEHVTPKK
jgi:oligoribonuclease